MASKQQNFKDTLKHSVGLKAYWTINKAMVKQIGLTETLVLQHIIDLEAVFKRDEIFQPIPKMAEELGLSEWSLKQAIGKLKSAELIFVERKSVGFMNFYSVNQNKVLELMSGSVNSLVSSNSTHQPDGHVSEMESNSQWSENQLTVSSNSTMSEVKNNSLTVENLSAITNNTTNNTLQKIETNNTTAAKAGNLKNITERILDVLINPDTPTEDYNNAIDDYNELGGLDGVAKILEWDNSVKRNYALQITTINSIK
jgi:hypothetical protein